jgi:predicted nucleotidyltransferase
MEFSVLVERLVEDSDLKQAIADLLKAKMKGEELDRGPAIPVISDFIRSELKRLEKEMPRRVNPKADSEKLNEFFRFALTTVW